MSKSAEKFKYLLFAGIGLICIILVIADAQKAPKVVASKRMLELEEKLDPSAWKTAPDIQFVGYGEDDFSLYDFKGKIVLLNFWTSWCPPCVNEFPGLLRLMKKFKGEIVLVAITNDETKEDIEGYLDRFREEFQEELSSPYFHIAWDRDKTIAIEIFHTEMYPETIIVSKQGLMAKKIVGDIDWEKQDIIEYLKKLLEVNNASN